MNRRIVVFGSFLAVFLMLMIPVNSAVEHTQVKETQETLLQESIDTIRENIINMEIKSQKLSALASNKNIDIEKIKDTFKDMPSSLKLIKDRSYMGDPGDGEDGNGPDDITDWIWGILFWIPPFIIINMFCLLVSLPLLFALGFIYGSVAFLGLGGILLFAATSPLWVFLLFFFFRTLRFCSFF